MRKNNVAFVTDENYLPYLSVTILSLLENNTILELTINVLHNGILPEKYEPLNNIAKEYGTVINWIKIDDHKLKGLILNHHFTIAAYYKLLLVEEIHENKVLFLDSDIVVNGSVAPLFELELGNYYLAAVESPIFDTHESLEMDNDAKGFNSGVMLLNLKKWKEDDISNKVIQFVKTHSDVIKWVDNCGLNSVVNGNFLKLEPVYNLTNDFLDNTYKEHEMILGKEKLFETRKNPIIIHYTGTLKPWHYLSKHPYKKLYWHYLKKTPYKNLKPGQISIKTVIEKHLPGKLRVWAKKLFNTVIQPSINKLKARKPNH